MLGGGEKEYKLAQRQSEEKEEKKSFFSLLV